MVKLYERRTYKKSCQMVQECHTQWKYVAEFKTKKMADAYIKKLNVGRPRDNFEYKMELSCQKEKKQ